MMTTVTATTALHVQILILNSRWTDCISSHDRNMPLYTTTHSIHALHLFPTPFSAHTQRWLKCALPCHIFFVVVTHRSSIQSSFFSAFWYPAEIVEKTAKGRAVKSFRTNEGFRPFLWELICLRVARF